MHPCSSRVYKIAESQRFFTYPLFGKNLKRWLKSENIILKSKIASQNYLPVMNMNMAPLVNMYLLWKGGYFETKNTSGSKSGLSNETLCILTAQGSAKLGEVKEFLPIPFWEKKSKN